jgi:hypothetical protein
LTRYFLAVIAIAVVFTGCGNRDNSNSNANIENNATPQPTTQASGGASQGEPTQEEIPWPTGEYVNDFPESDTTFELDGTQMKLFEEYSRDFEFDVNVLKGASPVDIAMVYIECGLHGYWLGEYNLWFFEEDVVAKESYRDENSEDISKRDIRSRREMADIVFANLSKGEFVDEGNGYGYIKFIYVNPYSEPPESETKLRMRQSSDDLWMVRHPNPFE